jgi:hypothetical protein
MACCNLTSPELSARSVAQRSLGSWTSPSRPRPCRRSYATVTTAATGTRGHVNERGLAVKLSSIRSRDVIANAAKASEAATLIRKDTSGPAPVIGAEPVEEPVNFKVRTIPLVLFHTYCFNILFVSKQRRVYRFNNLQFSSHVPITAYAKQHAAV